MLKRIQNLKETFEILQSERKAACSELEEEVEMIRAQAEVKNLNKIKSRSKTHTYIYIIKCLFQIAKTELDMFQRLLEEEVQKGQQEKKDHQEKMKVLKMENKAQADLNDR